MTTFTLRLDDSVRERVRAVAADSGRSEAAVVKRALEYALPHLEREAHNAFYATLDDGALMEYVKDTYLTLAGLLPTQQLAASPAAEPAVVAQRQQLEQEWRGRVGLDRAGLIDAVQRWQLLTSRLRG